MAAPFWKTKTLDEMTQEEWESLCDGCGRCCLHKLRDEETQALSFTNVACRLLNTETCRCSDYENRFAKVPDCVQLTPETLPKIDWLPPSCAYRLIEEGRDLPAWHPLRSGTTETVVASGASATGRIISERDAGMLEHHIVDWPGRVPRVRRPSRRA
jgi:uncharacterized cysteine cluster protein YcgN (CxxCxxCC family)